MQLQSFFVLFGLSRFLLGVRPRGILCTNDQFDCGDGECIQTAYQCDCENDCSNGEDEKNCSSGLNVSTTSYCFSCSIGPSVPIFRVCDGKVDCWNQDDERNCVVGLNATSPNCFPCDNGRCISLVYVCDGDNDCPNGEDETNCRNGQNGVVKDDSFICSNGRGIPMSYICDGDKDCRNAEDEKNCTASQMATIAKTHTYCDKGKRLRKTYICDGDHDCEDGEDERNCTSEQNAIISERRFTCDSGRRIQLSFKCDGDNDCEKGEDERNCTGEEIANSRFTCDTGPPIQMAFKCDGDNDCENGEDEKNCTGTRSIPFRTSGDQTFTCDSGNRIFWSLKCDGDLDCENGEDERNCPQTFTCQDGKIIPPTYKCDGSNDCKDGDDEINCPRRQKGNCGRQFKCDDGSCLPLMYKCDREPDCSLGEDELNCGRGRSLRPDRNCVTSMNCAGGRQCSDDGNCHYPNTYRPPFDAIPFDNSTRNCKGSSPQEMSKDNPDNCWNIKPCFTGSVTIRVEFAVVFYNLNCISGTLIGQVQIHDTRERDVQYTTFQKGGNQDMSISLCDALNSTRAYSTFRTASTKGPIKLSISSVASDMEMESWSWAYVTNSSELESTCYQFPYQLRHIPHPHQVYNVKLIEGSCMRVYADIRCSRYSHSAVLSYDGSSVTAETFHTEFRHDAPQFYRTKPPLSFSSCAIGPEGEPKQFFQLSSPEVGMVRGIVVRFENGASGYMEISKEGSTMCGILTLNPKRLRIGKVAAATAFDVCVALFPTLTCSEDEQSKAYVVNATGSALPMEFLITPPQTFRSFGTCEHYEHLRSNPGTTAAAEPFSTLLVVFIAIAILAIVGLTILVLILYWKTSRSLMSVPEVDEFYALCSQLLAGRDGGNETFPLPSSSGKIEQDDLNEESNVVLGSGNFGCVVRGMLSLGQFVEVRVAVKCIKPTVSRDQLNATLEEVKVNLHVTGHKYVVGFFGVCAPDLQKGAAKLVFEFCGHGSLLQYVRKKEDLLKGSSGSSLAVQVLQWWSQIADGMDHISRKDVVHGDLAARNCLLNASLDIKISDFGLSRKMYNYGRYVRKSTEEMLPWRWMSPESLEKLIFTPQSDVWAFRVTMWEVFSFGAAPYPNLSWNTNFVDWLSAGMRLERPNACSEESYRMMMSCWSYSVKQRPGFEVLKTYARLAVEKMKEEGYHDEFYDIAIQ